MLSLMYRAGNLGKTKFKVVWQTAVVVAVGILCERSKSWFSQSVHLPWTGH